MLRFDDRWIWDFWFAQDGPDTHVFYLQADRALKDERLRHWNVSIGHAVSQDLRQWEVLPDALAPSPPHDGKGVEPFDTMTTWTGSVIRHAGTWYMFYTGSRRSEKGLIQRIGLATSDDLLTWEKYSPHPLIEADPQWYEMLDLNLWHDQAWRDPFIYQDRTTGLFHAFITARINNGAGDARGVIGHATSTNLLEWTVGPPVTPAGEFGHMEVPQVLQINNTYYLVFCCPIDNFSHRRREQLKANLKTGTFCLTSDQLTGPFTYDTEQTLHADEHGSLYSGKIIQTPDNRPVFMAFQNFDKNGNFVGSLIDPLTLSVGRDGRLTVNTE